MKLISALLLIILCVSASAPAEARGAFKFGDQDKIHSVQSISVKGPKGETLFLGRRIKTTFFGLGVYVADEGYVLGISGAETAYYPMPNEQRIKLFQAAKILPSPLPEYKMKTADLVMGYSLYLLILVLGIVAFLKIGFDKVFKRKQKA
jgi:hypothetical protein